MTLIVTTQKDGEVVYEEADGFTSQKDGDLEVWRGDEVVGLHARGEWMHVRRKTVMSGPGLSRFATVALRAAADRLEAEGLCDIADGLRCRAVQCEAKDAQLGDRT